MLENENKKKIGLSVVALIAFVLTIAFSFYFEASSFTTQQEIDAINAKIAELERQQEEATSETGTLSQLQLLNAQLEIIESGQLFWSRIVEKIENTIPRRGDSTVQTIELTSYSGGEDGKMILNAHTRGDSPAPFEDIAGLITAFTAEPSFASVFVPSITKNLTPEGETVLGFSANITYEQTSL
ncbi:hypothetical protein COV82_02595 [Candidatus Peregrinibacteria bacterium CG11_big_fil_rev_8_21_14_0_20_46_8]|nr:MAG: hypothetical protein COV82_02595 [Candidatus Peregrinibacteria bacterium CG11_big_fil_rev_8_21_14_0_20_46_8]